MVTSRPDVACDALNAAFELALVVGTGAAVTTASTADVMVAPAATPAPPADGDGDAAATADGDADAAGAGAGAGATIGAPSVSPGAGAGGAVGEGEGEGEGDAPGGCAGGLVGLTATSVPDTSEKIFWAATAGAWRVATAARTASRALMLARIMAVGCGRGRDECAGGAACEVRRAR
ncbi:hypothetical protein BC831DRAFT_461287 [Entophlyctis helioformis]|nr:hypothetical protein BC831DRAFT_461287 [Entophlyctis helioformis]